MFIVELILDKNMSNSNDSTASKKQQQNSSDFQTAGVNESKFWRKVKQDPVVPIGIYTFFLF